MVSSGWDFLTLDLIQLDIVDHESFYPFLQHKPWEVNKEGVVIEYF